MENTAFGNTTTGGVNHAIYVNDRGGVTISCTATGPIIDGQRREPLIIGEVGFRLALKLVWRSIVGWKPPKDGSRAVSFREPVD